MDESVSARLVVPAAAEDVFAVLVDPSQHAGIDGTGWVTAAVDSQPLTAVGEQFRMTMHHPDHPDGSYETVNEVIAYAEARTVAWRTGYVEPESGELRFGGWWWRYDLVPRHGSTEVTLTYDWSEVGSGRGSTCRSRPFPTTTSPTRCGTSRRWSRPGAGPDRLSSGAQPVRPADPRRPAVPDPSTDLAGLPGIGDLPPEVLDDLLQGGRLVNIPEGWTPIHQQEPADKAYVVLEGRLDVVRDDEAVSEIGPGSLAGEMGLVDHRLRNARLTAAGPVRVLAWPRSEFQALRERHPDFDRLVRSFARARHDENDASA